MRVISSSWDKKLQSPRLAETISSDEDSSPEVTT
jgi:hypothetical protein